MYRQADKQTKKTYSLNIDKQIMQEVDMGKLNTACENIHAYIIDCSPDNTVDAGRVIIILCC